MFRSLVVASLALMTLGGPPSAIGAPRVRCPGGRFVAATAPLVAGDTATEAWAVVLSGGQVAIGGSCVATTVKTKATGHGTVVRAAWPSCTGLSGRVRLRALIQTGCSTIAGVIRARHTTRHFIATRQPECGNGIREAHEQCDGGACCSDDCEAKVDPACPGDHPCTTDADCATAEFCARPDGQCSGAGVCSSTDVSCTAVVAPVCGCDGTTYSNGCEAARKGVGVASPGECNAPHCGSGDAAACGDGQFCERPPGVCGGTDASGTCIDLPATCIGVLEPVCGCDGRTYVNDCFRQQAGIAKQRDGHCGCRDLMCSPGTKAVDTNDDGCPDHCIATCDDACDCSGNPGIEFTKVCPLACVVNGPCGDFWTCEDHVCVEHCGLIPTDDQICPPPPTCSSNDDCADGSYCASASEQCDGPGRCVPKPAVCPQVFAPVCGCDDKTYQNPCDAAGHGARIARKGPCDCAPPPCAAVFKPIDTNGDGCPDTCATPCEQTCDCYADKNLEFAKSCPLDCASCGEFWRCEDGACVEHCGPVPPGNDQCHVPPDFCATNDDCTATQYCAGIPGVVVGVPGAASIPNITGILGSCDGPGICVDRPDTCTAEAAPVCGCDGQTYSNACGAAAAGVRVAKSGACEPCHDVTCNDGTTAFDTDGDGCTDTCRKPCKTFCDCVSPPFLSKSNICPLTALCPAPFCGGFSTCEDGFCVDRCGPIPLGIAQPICVPLGLGTGTPQ